MRWKVEFFMIRLQIKPLVKVPSKVVKPVIKSFEVNVAINQSRFERTLIKVLREGLQGRGY
jgi:hypothetical protein